MEKSTRTDNCEGFLKGTLANNSNSISDKDIQMLSPTILAYIGDAVYEVFVRTSLIKRGFCQSDKLHKKTVSYVRAKAQAELIDKIFECLTEEEIAIFKRGRNTKTTSMPKNADIMEYKQATGFETLVGYLYLNQHLARLFELMNYIVDIMENETDEKK